MNELFGTITNFFTSSYWNNKASNGELIDVNSCNNAWYKVGFNALSNIAGFSNYTNGITCDSLPQTRVRLIDNRKRGRTVALVVLIVILVVAIIVVKRAK